MGKKLRQLFDFVFQPDWHGEENAIYYDKDEYGGLWAVSPQGERYLVVDFRGENLQWADSAELEQISRTNKALPS